MQETIQEKLMQFIQNSPTAFHAVSAMKKELNARGFTELSETESWELKPGGQYYVTRNGSSLLSFRLPQAPFESFHIIASHSDSPTYKLKPGPAVKAAGNVLKLNVEKYGGGIDATWFDRPLSLAGRVVVDEGDSLREELVRFDRDLLMIPSLAIHLAKSREEKTINVQNDMQPVLALSEDADALWKLVADAVQAEPEQILGADLYLCSRQQPVLWGAEREFLAGPRLDDLECCYCSFLGFLDSRSENDVAVHCVFDNEETGSRSRQGADSSFLSDALRRICRSFSADEEAYFKAIARSFLVSADNAHAVHPNYPQMSDPVNRPELNKGIVLKYQGEQRYATDAVSAAIFKKICRAHDIPVQEYTNRSDLPGGSTLGSISITQVPLRTVDIGLAQWAMHSVYESAGSLDAACLAAFSKAFYSEPLPVIEGK